MVFIVLMSQSNSSCVLVINFECRPDLNDGSSGVANAKIQQMYVGSRETASTCHVLNSHQTVVHTKPFATNNVPDLVVPKAEGQKTNLRRTPRKVKRPITTIETKAEPQKDDPRMIFK